MDNQLFQRIKDLLMQHQNIGVVVKPNPSLDDMAAGLGMYLVLKNMGKAVSIACPTDPTVAVSSLVGIQDVKKTLGSVGNTPAAGSTGGDLTVSFPYKEGEIEKVSYDMDQATSRLNIHVKAGPLGLSFQNSDVQFVRQASQAPVSVGSGEAPSLLFTIGVLRLSDIASIFNQAANPNTTIVNIDNKAENEKFGDVVHVAPRFSSISEEVADFLTLLEPQIELDRDTSQNLFDGISVATKDYTSPTTSYLAFEMAGILMKKGAQRGPKQQAQVPAGQPVGQYFPPIPNSPLGQAQVMSNTMQPFGSVQGQPQPVQQPMPQQPIQQYVQQQPAGNMQGQSFQQPISQPQQFSQPVAQPQMQYNPAMQPMQPQMQQPVQQPTQQQPQQAQEAPADWLTPKVYKGSSIL